MNDADSIANGVVVDPGVIAMISNQDIAEQTDPETSSSGGTIYWRTVILFICLCLFRQKVVKKTLVRN